MTQEQWNTKVDAAIKIYQTAINSYIDTTKSVEFEKFIIGRTNLMK